MSVIKQLLAASGSGISGPPDKMRQNELIYWEDTAFNDRFNNTYDANSYALQYAFAGPGASAVNVVAVPSPGSINGLGGGGWTTKFTPAPAALMVPGQWWWQAILTGNPLHTVTGYIDNGSGLAGNQLTVQSISAASPAGALIVVNEAVSGSGAAAGTYITAVLTGGGGVGTFQVSGAPQLKGSSGSPLTFTLALARIVAAEGDIWVEQDLSTATTPYDGRSTMEIGLANAENALTIFQSSGGRIKHYTIAGRQMAFQDDKEIRELCDWFRARVASEKSEASGGQDRMIRIGFSPPSSGVPTANSKNWPWW